MTKCDNTRTESINLVVGKLQMTGQVQPAVFVNKFLSELANHKLSVFVLYWH